MPSNDPTILIILSEIIVIQTIIIIGAATFYIINKKKNKKQIEESIRDFKESRNERVKTLTTAYEKHGNENVNELIEDILDKETAFHSTISNMFYKNKISEFLTIKKSIYEMVIPYEKLSESAQKEEIIVETSNADSEPDIDNAINELLSENTDYINDIDPALDLSGNTEDLGIAEIPDELLNNNTIDSDESNQSK